MNLLTRTLVTPTLPVIKSGAYAFTIAAQLDLTDVRAGDVWTFDAAAETTTSYDANIFNGRYLKVTTALDSSYATQVDQTEGVLLARPMGRNITLDIHHDMVDLTRSWTATADGPARVLLVLYAASTQAPVPPAAAWNLAISYVELAATLTHRELPV